jgi:RND family efflux transporter MFP subunit
MKTLWHRALLYLLAGWCVLLTACQPEQAAPPPPPPQVTVNQPVLREVIEWDEYTGRLEAVESVDVRARVSGYLQSVHFTDGASVKKGALLFVIDPRPYQAELSRAKAALEQAIAQSERARKDFARAPQLIKSRAVSQEEVDSRAAEQRQAEEAVQAARAAVEVARLNVEFTQVRAPINGRISREFVTVGNLISGGAADSTLLTRIVSLEPIYCYFDVDERSYLKYSRLWHEEESSGFHEVKIPVYLGLADEQGFPHQGHLDFIDNRLDPNTGTMIGRAVFPNPKQIVLPGLFARIRLPGSSQYEALLIPDEAIGSDQTQRFAFVVNDQNTAEYRRVALGPIIDGLRIIRDGFLTQIGFVVLVGLACKNAILIVEFAKDRQAEGKDRVTAAIEACRLRLRPILMTSFAFILGVVPLFIAKGAGAEMLRALGTSVFSGMLGVTFFGLFLTPVSYVVIRWFVERAREKPERRWR